MPGFLALLSLVLSAGAVQLSGEAVQGGLIFGQAPPGSEVALDGQSIAISASGRFVLGFGRDASGSHRLTVRPPEGDDLVQTLDIQAREYPVEIVDGLPQRTVTPDPEAAERIRQEALMVTHARARRDSQADYAQGFDWPAHGRVSGVYGSQRVLNGVPARPHYGVDIAAPEGAPVYAPADGLVTLTHPDMYYSGGTLIIDHGQGLSSTFLHLSEIVVETGRRVQRGELVARVGMTGRANGPHLDWRMNWLDQRVDPQRLVTTVGGMAAP